MESSSVVSPDMLEKQYNAEIIFLKEVILSVVYTLTGKNGASNQEICQYKSNLIKTDNLSQ